MLYEQGSSWIYAGGSAGQITVSAHEIRAEWPGSVSVKAWKDRPFPVLADMLAVAPIEHWQAFGWMSFELAQTMYPTVGRNGSGAADWPVMHLVIPHTQVLISADLTVVRSLSRQGALEVLDLLDTTEPLPPAEPSPVATDVGREEYCAAVEAAVSEIKQGLFEKVVLSRRVPIGHPVDLVKTYHLGRSTNTPARSFLLSLGGISAAGLSPEIIVEVDSAGQVSTQPLAGTRARGSSPEDEQRLEKELLTDPKEIYEHAISMRSSWSELSTVCVPGSVRVDEPMRIRHCGAVQHIGSVVSGQLARGQSALDALGAVFPAVTASGIPRAEACDCIARLEPQPRGIYGGAVLKIDSDGRLDATLVLRSVFQVDGQAWLQAGAGIVRDSRPEREFQETREKLGSIAPYIVGAAGAQPATAAPSRASAHDPGTGSFASGPPAPALMDSGGRGTASE
ncbi:MAG: salicylate synthase [Actinomycetota bacterium]|nr:salicylate synthase [Actinomycetota bacterium]